MKNEIMNIHQRHHSADMEYDMDYVERRPFSRHSTGRSSLGNLKQPKLPGSEKFRFGSIGEGIDSSPTTLEANRQAVLATPILPHRYSSQRGSRRISDGQQWRPGTDSKRRPVLPISKNTSRVLNNTNVELSAETVDFIRSETSRLSIMCRDYVGKYSPPRSTDDSQSDQWSCSSSDQSVEETARQRTTVPESYRTPAPPVIVQHGGMKRIGRELNNNTCKQYAGINRNGFHRIPSRLSTSSSSPTQSICSNDDDIWVMRTPHHNK